MRLVADGNSVRVEGWGIFFWEERLGYCMGWGQSKGTFAYPHIRMRDPCVVS
jgi:hypothetical protein